MIFKKKKVKYSSNGNVLKPETFKREFEHDTGIIKAWVLVFFVSVFLIIVPSVIIKLCKF